MEQQLETYRNGSLHIELASNIGVEAVLEAISGQSEQMKHNDRATVYRSGCYVVKKSPGRNGIETVRHIFRDTARSWKIGLELLKLRVCIPRPVAFAQKRRAGLSWVSYTVTEYLAEAVDIEAFADRMIRDGAPAIDIEAYLGRLADAVKTLIDKDIYHNDLAGKNILTVDGRTFYFIDWDGMVLGCPYTHECRMRNLVQLYDSLNDRWGDDLLQPFLGQLLAPGETINTWMPAIKRRQALRRARTVARWRKEGKLPASPPE